MQGGSGDKYVQRFWAKVSKGDGCWLWTAAVDKEGHGVFGTPTQRAHRISWQLATGTPPGLLHITHSCGTPACVNPEHLVAKAPPARRERQVVVRRSVSERFWARVLKGDGCWIWQGPINKSGYGAHGKGARLAHRISWEMSTGQDPGSLFVCHRCDSPPCVRPDHLFLGTHLDNMRDMDAKGRRRGTFQPGMNNAGESHGRAKLTDDAVRQIRGMYRAGVSCKDIAPLFGIASNTAYQVAARRKWAHVVGWSHTL